VPKRTFVLLHEVSLETTPRLYVMRGVIFIQQYIIPKDLLVESSSLLRFLEKGHRIGQHLACVWSISDSQLWE